MSGALSHVRVLDLSRVFAGPWCTQMLADFGADVIKVELPGAGDDVRHMGAVMQGVNGADTGLKSSFIAMNRNKRSVTIDFARPEGQALVRDLARRVDVVVENFKTGGLARYGLDYASLSALNPRLVYCSITGFGQTGPRAREPGYDAIFQALSGLMSITGDPDKGPALVGYSTSDINAGLYAAIAVLIALNHRDNVSGQGQHIDLSLFDAQIASMSHVVMNHLVTGRTPTRAGSASQINSPWQAFACLDGELMITIGNNRQFRLLADVLGLPDLAADPRFTDNGSRLLHRDALLAILVPEIASRRSAELMAALAAAGVPAAPINDLSEALAEPQARARELVRSVTTSAGQAVPTLANPIRFSSTPAQYSSAPPGLGEHTRSVLSAELGLADADLTRLREAGVI